MHSYANIRSRTLLDSSRLDTVSHVQVLKCPLCGYRAVVSMISIVLQSSRRQIPLKTGGLAAETGFNKSFCFRL